MTMPDSPTVFVVDDDPTVLKALRDLIRSSGLAVQTYASAQEFLAAYDPKQPGCLVLDVRMPGQSGLELQRELSARNLRLPTIIVTGFADVHVAVRAMKAGAVDVIEKPFSSQVLLDRIEEALERDRQERSLRDRRARFEARVATLTRREREVMDRVVAGKPNKEIAAELGLSLKTVEGHRARVMEKMQVDSLADLIRLAITEQAGKA
ncbi:MAG: response regulator transcription factor [Candidatus Binatia bacterium]